MSNNYNEERKQAGEILPPELYEAYWSERLQSQRYKVTFKEGMEFCFQQLKPYLKAALPHYEAGLRDTRLGQADARKLAELAAYKEIACYEK